ncbi:MAG: hypothetical protein ACO3A2_09440 [Bdellovibrionia bacterium]
MNLIELLKQRTQCLEEILSASIRFLHHLERQDLSQLDSFEAGRNRTFQTLQNLDRKIQTAAKDQNPREKTLEFQTHIRKVLDQNQNIIYNINRNDLRIIELIENEKSQLLKNLFNTHKSIQTMGKFRSVMKDQSGNHLDEKV